MTSDDKWNLVLGLVNDWIAREHDTRALVDAKYVIGVEAVALIARADQLAECRRKLQEVIEVKVTPVGIERK